MTNAAKRSDDVQEYEEYEIGIAPTIDTVPSDEEHQKSMKEGLHEIVVDEQQDDVAGPSLARTPSRASVLQSRFRTVALVLTLTGASFLNVSTVGLFQPPRRNMIVAASCASS